MKGLIREILICSMTSVFADRLVHLGNTGAMHFLYVQQTKHDRT